MEIDARNAEEASVGGTAIHGITQFADRTDEEFKIGYLNYLPPPDAVNRFLESAPINASERKLQITKRNWVGILTTPIKDQGFCGSCWAFSAVQQIESAGIKAGILSASTTQISTQQLVSCNTITDSPPEALSRGWYNSGCGGGNMQKAYYYVFWSGGLTSNKLYPYVSGTTGSTGACNRTRLTDYKIKVIAPSLGILLSGEAAQIDYVLNTGPLSALMNSLILKTYVSGIISASVCSTSMNHAVQIVGVDTVNNYWIVRNSWGDTWGQAGYFLLELNKNTCGISQYTSYVNVGRV